MGKKNISLLIPCYNCAETVSDTIRQAREQTVPFSEIICYDDCSSDETINVLRAQNVQIIQGAANKGPAYARNRLLEASNYEFVHFHDADDPFYSTEFVEKLAPIAGPRTVAFCQWIRRDSKNEDKRFDYEDVSPATDFIEYLINKHIHLNAMIFPKNGLLEFGGFPEWIRGQEDLGFNMRCSVSGLDFRIIREVLAIHIRNTVSLTASFGKKENHLMALQLVQTLINEFPKHYHNLLCQKFLFHAKSLALNGDIEYIEDYCEFIQQIPKRLYSGGLKERLFSSLFGIKKTLKYLAKRT